MEKSLLNWYARINSGSILTSNQSTNQAINKFPTYSYSGIKDVPAVKFNGSDQSFSFDCSFLNNTDYTIIITEMKGSNDNNPQYLLQDDTNNLFLGYNSDSSIIHSQSGALGVPTAPANDSASYAGAVPAYSGKGTSRQIVFRSSSASGKSVHINGAFIAESTNKDKISSLSTCRIGKGYNGYISQIAIYKRALAE